MSAGELRNYVQLESFTSTPDGTGQHVETWGIVASVWCAIKYNSGKEDSGDRDSTIQRADIKIRWRNDVDNKMRVSFGNMIFDIEDNYDPSGKNQYLILRCVVVDGTPASEAAIIAPTGISRHTDITGAHAVYGVLAGAVDSANTTYVVSSGAYKSGSLDIEVGGVGVNDFTETDITTGTLDIGYAPTTGSVVRVSYEI